jgi:hypothetical protein
MTRHAGYCSRGPHGGQALLHLGEALRALALPGQRHAPEERPQGHVTRKPVLGRQGQHDLGVRLDRLPLPAIALDESTRIQRIHQVEGVCHACAWSTPPDCLHRDCHFIPQSPSGAG